MDLKYLKNALIKTHEFTLYGNRRKRKLSIDEFCKDIIQDSGFQPIFFLSTGRTGTNFFTNLLEEFDNIFVIHSPSALICNSSSELIISNRLIYEYYQKSGIKDSMLNKLLGQLFFDTREKLIYGSYLHDKQYIETNNRVTFFAPAIKALFPNAKFVHLYRHPGKFIRSGMRRGYYECNNIHEKGRIVPLENNKYYLEWKKFDRVEKIAWLWNETNSFIDNFGKNLNKDSFFQFNFDNLNVENIKQLNSFLGFDCDSISTKKINDLIGNPTNVQNTGNFKSYMNWSELDKNKVKNICGELSSRYGYVL